MNDQTKPALYALTPEQNATVQAALAYYKERVEDGFSENLWECIATKDGTLNALGAFGIDVLVKRLEGPGLDFSEVVPLFAESAQDSPYVAAAQANAREGEIEVDEPAVVSKGDDDGAYVMGWVWVSDEAAGIVPDEDDDEENDK